jgi:hypothetical protein
LACDCGDRAKILHRYDFPVTSMMIFAVNFSFHPASARGGETFPVLKRTPLCVYAGGTQVLPASMGGDI